ncbi:MAG: DUF3369 domain-containing protein [Desulfobacterales bacterium]|nr:DUF3369 domain-containing protein [Desulfobacterales bacterium]
MPVKKNFEQDSGALIFADEVGFNRPIKREKPQGWKILIADDEEEIHIVSKMVLSDYKFEGRGLTFLHAYSGEETKKIMKEHEDTAILLLDVVMETDNAGLMVAKAIREELKNKFVRIVLRTGQPGKAPETNVIMEYDINEYKEKTELTTQKLFTTITSALRSYRDLKIIDKNRRALEKIVNSSQKLFEIQPIKKFTSGMLTQLISILQLNEESFYKKASGFAASQFKDKYCILAATGDFSGYVDRFIDEVMPKEIQERLNKAINQKNGFFIEDSYIGYFQTEKGFQNLLYLNGCKNLSELDKDLIRVYCTNVAIAYDNIYLNQEIVDTQKEIIFTLGEVVDTRSKETFNHVRRVAEVSSVLAVKAGMSEEKSELLRLAAPMHDIGKIGIPDSILNKPGPFTKREYTIMKLHTVIGYELLKKSKREIMKAAAIVAQQHHERWDGRGYHQGLKGEDIDILGRITSLADLFDALSHSRVYKDAWDIQRIIDLFKDERGKHLDPNLTDVFLKNIDEFVLINDKYSDDDKMF